MNRFDEKFWEGARESALAIHDYVNRRTDVPTEVREFVLAVLKRAGERKNRDFREALGLEPYGPTSSREDRAGAPYATARSSPSPLR